MSVYGDQLAARLEDPIYRPTKIDIDFLLYGDRLEADDSATIDIVLDRLELTKSQFAYEFAKVAENLIIDGQRIGDASNYDNQQIVQIFIEPPQTFLGEEGSLLARNRLLLGLVADKLDTTTATGSEQFFRNNVSEVESLVIGSANQVSFLDALLYVGRYAGALLEEDTGTALLGLGDSPFAGPTSAEEVNARLAEALADSADPDLTEEQQRQADDISDATAKQCVLLNLLQPLNEFYDEALNYTPDPNNLPYGGKIVKFKCNPVSHLTNYLTSIADVNDFYTNKKQSEYSYLMQPIVDVRVSFIRSDGNNNLIELPIINSSNKITRGETQLNADPNINVFQSTGNAFEASIKNHPFVEAMGGEDGKALTPAFSALQNINFNVDISYAGTNPSTARNDVDVVMTFRASSIDEFNKSWNYEYDMNVNYNLFDLVLFPFYDKDSDGYGRVFKSQFSPNYNRLRLYYRARANKTPQGTSTPRADDAAATYEWYLQNSNVLDLTVIDHDFSRNGETDEYELKITYKGYIQSLLTRPETDALSDSTIKAKRRDREKLLQAAADKGCTQAEVNKIITSLNTAAQADIRDISSGILRDLNDRIGSVTGLGIFCLDNSRIKESLREDGSLELEKIKQFIVSNTPITADNGSSSLANASSIPTSTEQLNEVLESTDNIYFFYIADLLDVILEHSDLFTSGGVSTSKNSIRQELKFILGSFNYTDTKGNTYNLNIGHVPISLAFFKEWFKETIVDKELFLYPCLSFVRDLFERVLTNLLSEVCFKTTEEQRFLVRTSFFAGSKKLDGVFSDDSVYDFYMSGLDKIFDTAGRITTIAGMSQVDNKSFPLIKTDFDSTINDYNNYCVIYVQGPSIAADPNDSRFVTEFHINNGEVLGEKDFSFSKTDQTGLREARYFRNSSSGITMLSSVYNTTVNLEVPLCFLYPGQYYKITMEGTNGLRPNFHPSSKSPAFFIFEELGIDGYYVITKSSYKLFGAMNNLQAECEISGIWVSSHGQTNGLRVMRPDEDRIITDPTEIIELDNCNILVNMAQEVSVRALAGDIEGSGISDDQIEAAFDISQRASAEEELTGPLAIGGFGTQAEREALIDAVRSPITTPGLIGGTLTSPDGTINYGIFTDDEDNINIIDQSNGSIIGVFQQTNTGDLVFSENTGYFGGTE